jgi:hypothetical protein
MMSLGDGREGGELSSSDSITLITTELRRSDVEVVSQPEGDGLL